MKKERTPFGHQKSHAEDHGTCTDKTMSVEGGGQQYGWKLDEIGWKSWLSIIRSVASCPYISGLLTFLSIRQDRVRQKEIVGEKFIFSGKLNYCITSNDTFAPEFQREK